MSSSNVNPPDPLLPLTNHPSVLPAELQPYMSLYTRLILLTQGARHMLQNSVLILHPFKLIWQTYTRICILFGLLLTITFGVPAWRGLQLQIWTAGKEYHDYCVERLVCFVDM